MLGQPLGQLSRGPGTLSLLDLSPEGGEEFRGKLRGLADVGLVGQPAKPWARNCLTQKQTRASPDPQEAGDLGNAHAGCGQAHHLQAVSRARLGVRIAGEAAQLLVLFFGQVDAIQAGPSCSYHTHFTSQSLPITP